MNSICEQAFQGYRFAGKSKHDACTVYRLKDAHGAGEMVCYDIARGIQISYNNLSMASCFQPITPAKEFLQINHCLEGCYEFELENSTVSFLGEGDLCVNDLSKLAFIGSRFPMKKYRGLTVLFDIKMAQQTLESDFSQTNINLFYIRDTLCQNGQSLPIRSRREIDHIFSELYHVDERIRMPYLWVKVIELLLFLSLLDSSHMQQLPVFSEAVSQATKHVYQYIIEKPFSKTTISELASVFNVAESSMKRCFKSLSGHSIGTFMKRKRMEAAADLMVAERNLSIGEVAEAAGYENQSKFSSAFKSVFGVTPFAYRNK